MASSELGLWAPMPLDEAVSLFAAFRARWWVSGGHALEAHLDATWRAHDDTDISICRADVSAVRELLADWDIHVAAAGTLTPWEGEPLESKASQNNLWCRRTRGEPWILDLTISDGDDKSWIYRRKPTIVRPWREAILESPAGIPYLAPELQLLFKSEVVRAKDDHDALMAIPALEGPARDRLASWLAADHPWQRLIGRALAGEAASQFGLDGEVTQLAAGRSSQAWLVGDYSVVRVPIANSGRLLSYRSEKVLGDRLHDAGATMVATWQLADIDGSLCSVGPWLNGRPIDYSETWSDTLVADLAITLHTVHSLGVDGFGPLANTDGPLRGTSPSRRRGIVDRWFHAPIWPFDDISFDQHVIHTLAPDLGDAVHEHRQAILDAEAGPTGIVHSDLHREHVLVNEDDGLAGLLDFGDAFVGALAWDFALLCWYYGEHNARRVADVYPGGNQLVRDGATLALAVALYKLAKTPTDITIIDRLRRLVERSGIER